MGLLQGGRPKAVCVGVFACVRMCACVRVCLSVCVCLRARECLYAGGAMRACCSACSIQWACSTITSSAPHAFVSYAGALQVERRVAEQLYEAEVTKVALQDKMHQW